jgi:4-amino-4-deoxy-L-arabinose transferase-like glycosyltransferase
MSQVPWHRLCNEGALFHELFEPPVPRGGCRPAAIESDSIFERMNNRAFHTMIAVLVALNVAKAGVFIAAGQPPLESDSDQYWYYGRCVADGDLLIVNAAQTTRTPGYPWFLALFHATCGARALIAATAAQEAMVVVVALLTAWMCWKVTNSYWAVVIALGVNLFCFSRNGFALYIYSDSLLCFALTLAIALWIVWLKRPTAWGAVATGIALGLAALVKPVAEFAFVPLVLVMILRLRGLPWRAQTVQVACLCLAELLVAEPWRIRNQMHFGQPFLTKVAGVTLWWSCFRHGPSDRMDPPLDFTNDPATLKVTQEARGVNLTSAWAVRRELMRLGHPETETDDIMASVAKRAIASQPWTFVCGRCVRYAWFWLTPNGTFRPEPGQSHRENEDDAAGPSATVAAQRSYWLADQNNWHASWYFDRGLINAVWRPQVAVYAFATLAVIAGLVTLIRSQEHRLLGISMALWFLYFSMITVLAGRPEYRYRMVLEPAMIMVAASACVVGRVFSFQFSVFSMKARTEN